MKSITLGFRSWRCACGHDERFRCVSTVKALAMAASLCSLSPGRSYFSQSAAETLPCPHPFVVLGLVHVLQHGFHSLLIKVMDLDRMRLASDSVLRNMAAKTLLLTEEWLCAP